MTPTTPEEAEVEEAVEPEEEVAEVEVTKVDLKVKKVVEVDTEEEAEVAEEKEEEEEAEASEVREAAETVKDTVDLKIPTPDSPLEKTSSATEKTIITKTTQVMKDMVTISTKAMTREAVPDMEEKSRREVLVKPTGEIQTKTPSN